MNTNNNYGSSLGSLTLKNLHLYIMVRVKINYHLILKNSLLHEY